MLRSNKCHLTGKSEADLAKMLECPLDPGGYFVVKGTEKVILVQEQLSKNRIIVEAGIGKDDEQAIQASVTSSTHERKSKTYILTKNGRIWLKHNSFAEDIPIVIALKALGLSSDKEILDMVAGSSDAYRDTFAINLEAAAEKGVYTTAQALDYVGSRTKNARKAGPSASRKSSAEEALECFATVVVAHISVQNLFFRPKAIYIAMMVRRVLMALRDPKKVDDRDYVGNKRLEL